MKRTEILGLTAVGFALLFTAHCVCAQSKAHDKAEITRQIDNFVKAFRTRNLDLMMSLYAPGMVSFDIVPPLQDTGKDVYRKIWKKTFAQFKGPISIEMRDVHIVTGADVAFSYLLLHLRTMTAQGHKTDFWERMTFGFQKTGGKWLMVHEHVSVPADLANGKAVLNLTP